MQKLELTLPTAAENLALDEALLAACEAGEITDGVLRLWEPARHFVVLGRSSDPEVEVNLAACCQKRIPVLRRASGGGTIVAGPGCLMVAVVLSYAKYPELRSIDCAHCFVLQRIRDCLTLLVPGIQVVGTSDLAVGTSESQLQKFSGNALRAKRTHLLYHGTLLYDFDLDQLTQLLAAPTREPDYRACRHHREFVTNLPLSCAQLVAALTTGWQATESLANWPEERTQKIRQEKYANDPKWVITN
ncbi:lipoate--protein ligase family protein [Bythopirellula polymerisocia]|uniref:Putative lipoate-protein ligase A n=1 Tax=Bythopirellula polymerisocia TaxID=2528003 RepID=A0A5C6D2V7_9BACT|nr:lipoate--protein ligase family protein [Bythopirellula polymerisocia]TWU30111.1 putative lipoate-protein ligase A [Bythopirellula polymerisocia]